MGTLARDASIISGLKTPSVFASSRLCHTQNVSSLAAETPPFKRLRASRKIF
jgi:hypothetical protein